MKQIVRLTESDLHWLIKEAVTNILNQQDTLSPEAIMKLVYDTTGIRIDESRTRYTILEGNGVVSKDNSKFNTNESFLVNILLTYTEGIHDVNQIASMFSGNIEYGKDIGDALRDAFVMYFGDDKVNPPKLPVKSFREAVLNTAWNEVRRRLSKRAFKNAFGSYNKWRTDFETQLRDDSVIFLNDEKLNSVEDPENDYLETEEFRIHLEKLMVKYLGDEMTKEIILDFYSGKTYKELGEMFGFSIKKAFTMVKNGIEALRNSPGFKSEVSALLDGRYDEKGIKKLGMNGNVRPKGDFSSSVMTDYKKLVNDAYSRINGLNSSHDIQIPEGVGYKEEDFINLFTNRLLFDYGRRTKKERERICDRLRNMYRSSLFYRTWADYIYREDYENNN